MDKVNRTGCRHCRLEKCVKCGMRKELVRGAKNGSQKNRSGSQLNFAIELPSPTDNEGHSHSGDDGFSDGQSTPAVTPNFQDPKLKVQLGMLDALLHMECQYRRVSMSIGEVPRAYYQQFKSLEELIVAKDANLLSIANAFSGIPSVWSRQHCLEQVEKYGFFYIWPWGDWILDHFLSVDMAKSMPFFNKLNLSDQICLLSGLGQAVVYFCNFYYSAQKNAETVIKSDGLIPAAIVQQTRKYGSDPRLVQMSQRLYSHAIAPFRQVALSREEFVLTLGILFTCSSIPGLSPSAHQILYSESTEFACLLLRLLQSRLGILSGVHRYAEIIQLISLTFKTANYYHTYATYLDIFHLDGHRKEMLPRVLHPLYAME